MLYNIVLVSAVQCEPANMCVYICLVASVVSDSLRPHGPWPTRLLCPWDSPGKNPGVGCHLLLYFFVGTPVIIPLQPDQASLIAICFLRLFFPPLSLFVGLFDF